MVFVFAANTVCDSFKVVNYGQYLYIYIVVDKYNNWVNSVNVNLIIISQWLSDICLVNNSLIWALESQLKSEVIEFCVCANWRDLYLRDDNK